MSETKELADLNALAADINAMFVRHQGLHNSAEHLANGFEWDRTTRAHWPEIYKALRRLAVLEAGDMVLVPAQVVRFLKGEGALDGVWFGDRPQGERGNFWWRKYLAARPQGGK